MFQLRRIGTQRLFSRVQSVRRHVPLFQHTAQSIVSSRHFSTKDEEDDVAEKEIKNSNNRETEDIDQVFDNMDDEAGELDFGSEAEDSEDAEFESSSEPDLEETLTNNQAEYQSGRKFLRDDDDNLNRTDTFSQMYDVEEALAEDEGDRDDPEGSGTLFKEGDIRKPSFDGERAITKELKTRELDDKMKLAIDQLPPIPEEVRDILAQKPRLKILEAIWDKADLPEELKNINLLELNRALRTADHEFFNESFAEEVHEADAFTENRTSAERLFEADRRRTQDDEEKFINSLTDLVLVDIGSHARVTSDGLVNTTSCLIIGGNQRGYGGWGRGKAKDFEGAFALAKRDLRKKMVYIPRHENRTMFQSVIGKHNNTQVMMKLCRRGQGRTAGPLVGHILEAFGIQDISTRVYGGRNPYSVVYAVFNGLAQQVSARQMARERGVNYYTQFEPGVRTPKAMTYKEWKDQTKLVHSMLNQSAAEITRRFANQQQEKIRPAKEVMGVVENWSEHRAPDPRFTEETFENEVDSVNLAELDDEDDPVGSVFLPQVNTPRSVPKPLPRREVY